MPRILIGWCPLLLCSYYKKVNEICNSIHSNSQNKQRPTLFNSVRTFISHGSWIKMVDYYMEICFSKLCRHSWSAHEWISNPAAPILRHPGIGIPGYLQCNKPWASFFNSLSTVQLIITIFLMWMFSRTSARALLCVCVCHVQSQRKVFLLQRARDFITPAMMDWFK